MSKKIFLSPSNQDGNSYAAGSTNEYIQCKAIGQRAEEALRRCGFETKLECEPTMQTRVAHSNAWGADMHLCIHTNAAAGPAGGTQVYYGAYPAAAEAVFRRLAPITPGSSAECVRKNDSLYEVRCPKAVSVYVEAEFHHVKDQAEWIIGHKDGIAEAIAQGVCDYYGVTYQPPKAETLYRVQVGAFSVKANAEAQAAQLRQAGYQVLIKEE